MNTKLLHITQFALLSVCLICCQGGVAAPTAALAPTLLAPTIATAPTTAPILTAQPAVQPTSTATGSFTLASSEIASDRRLPVDYTCDGSSASLPLAWSGAPAGTVSYAVLMDHIASPQDIHWYWILYDIPANVTSLAKNSVGIGAPGNNSVNGKLAYSPPCSKGPGDKEYVLTVYALSARPAFSVPATQVNREVFLKGIQSIILASAELSVIYARK